jgi:hypothetical protein
MQRIVVALMLGWLALVMSSTSARADGGALRLYERANGYRIALFSSPTPLRAGPVDISLLVQDADTLEPARVTDVSVALTRMGDRMATLHIPATTEAATNKLLHAAVFDLPKPGRWMIEVAVEGSRGPGRVRFELEAAEPLPRWLSLWPWWSWPALAVLLYAIHQILVYRRCMASTLQWRRAPAQAECSKAATPSACQSKLGSAASSQCPRTSRLGEASRG